jgi:putative DNA primase/helicase
MDGDTQGHDFACTECGNAKRLIARYGDLIRFVPALRQWVIYDRNRWGVDELLEIYQLAKLTVEAIHEEALAAPGGSKQRDELIGWWKKSESRHHLNAMIDIAQSEEDVPIPLEAFDANPWLLNVTNGTLNLELDRPLRDHDPDDYLMKIAGTVYDPTAEAPLWAAHLWKISGENERWIRYLQKSVGSALVGVTHEQKFWIFHGDGANGKSKTVGAIIDALGDYAMHADPKTFMVKRSESVPEDVARLHGARFVATIETEHGQRLAESLIKQLTGGDRMVARRLYENSFQFVPQLSLFISTNRLPQIRGVDHAIWRRVQRLPFTVRIPEEEQDKALADKLRDELSGILRWCVEGTIAWRAEGLSPPEEVIVATEDYRRESDVLGPFLDEHITRTQSGRTGQQDLYDRYQTWAEMEGVVRSRRLKKRTFGEMLDERGFHRDRNSRTGRIDHLGLMLNPLGGVNVEDDERQGIEQEDWAEAPF